MFVCHKVVSFFLFVLSFFPFFLSLFLFVLFFRVTFLSTWEVRWYKVSAILFLTQCNSRHQLPVLNRDVIHNDLSTSLLCSFSTSSLPPFLSPLFFPNYNSARSVILGQNLTQNFRVKIKESCLIKSIWLLFNIPVLLALFLCIIFLFVEKSKGLETCVLGRHQNWNFNKVMIPVISRARLLKLHCDSYFNLFYLPIYACNYFTKILNKQKILYFVLLWPPHNFYFGGKHRNTTCIHIYMHAYDCTYVVMSWEMESSVLLHISLYIFINAYKRFCPVSDPFISISNILLISTYLEGKCRKYRSYCTSLISLNHFSVLLRICQSYIYDFLILSYFKIFQLVVRTCVVFLFV